MASRTSTRVSGAQRRGFRVDRERQWTIRELPEQMPSTECGRKWLCGSGGRGLGTALTMPFPETISIPAIDVTPGTARPYRRRRLGTRGQKPPGDQGAVRPTKDAWSAGAEYQPG